ncbi:MAG: DUF222 domain-containing protein [Pseudonocardia sp.]
MITAVDTGPDEHTLIEEIARLETVRHQLAARQAELVGEFARAHVASQTACGVVEPERLERSIAAQVGLACRVSPTEGRRRLRLARDLHAGLDRVRELFTAGELSEYAVSLIVAATAHLDPAERARVDAELATRRVESLGVRRVHDLARSVAARVAPEAFRRRCTAARSGRRVSVRPSADGMADLSAHLPVEQAVACYASLVRAAQDAACSPEPLTRSRGQVMADTLVARLTGPTGHTTSTAPSTTTTAAAAATTGAAADTATATTAGDSAIATAVAAAIAVPVEVQVIVPIEALLDPASPIPAEIAGHGPVPVEILRDATSWRRLLTRDGVVIGGDSRRRNFTGVLAELIRARDGHRCREPWCDAPIRHLDHIHRHRDGGPTSYANGRGLCAFHNLVRETPGWHAQLVDDTRHTVVTTTPTGHHYHSDIPPDPAPGPTHDRDPCRGDPPDLDALVGDVPSSPQR